VIFFLILRQVHIKTDPLLRPIFGTKKARYLYTVTGYHYHGRFAM